MPFPLDRRRFLAGAAATSAAALAAPTVLRAQPAAVKLGLVHPVTGWGAYSGGQCRAGAELAIADINAAGGLKSLGGAQLEAMLLDSQSKVEVGAAETAKAVEGGAVGIVGGFASSITLATTQEAAKTNTPHVVDVGVADQIIERGLPNVFRFGPGHRNIATFAANNLAAINAAAGSPAKTAMIVHEESAFGTATAAILNEMLPAAGIEVLETISHPNPQRDFTNIALRIRGAAPDIVIPSNYYNENALLMRTLRQQRIEVMALYNVLGGAASSYRFVQELPEIAEGVIDCNHWFNPLDAGALARKAAAEAKGLFYTYEVYLAYNAVALLADAIDRAGTTKAEAVNAALAASEWAGHGMPYGPTKMTGGQNEGAQPVNTQVQGGDIQTIFPAEFASAAASFPA